MFKDNFKKFNARFKVKSFKYLSKYYKMKIPTYL